MRKAWPLQMGTQGSSGGNSPENAQLAQVNEGEENAFAWTVTTEAKQARQDDLWCLDSGATAHMT